jgi:mannose/fructose/N-acetylgalactosamine-specific phosphotransferase system component IIB
LDFYTNNVRRLQITNDGRVGIGTSAPGAALDINTSSNQAYSGYYIKFNKVPGVQTLQSENFGPPWDISLRTVEWIYSGAGYMTSSDKRIKDIISKSDSKKDLEVLNSIIITDYTMKDKIADNKKYKKIIAQDLENIYPESVYKTKNIIPNIYKSAIAEKGIIFLETKLQKNTNVKIILEKENIISKVLNVSDTYFEIENKNISGNIFVYGAEVDDFLLIDYESVFCLNISATQELYSRMKKLENIVTFLEKKIDNLEKNLQSS